MEASISEMMRLSCIWDVSLKSCPAQRLSSQYTEVLNYYGMWYSNISSTNINTTQIIFSIIKMQENDSATSMYNFKSYVHNKWTTWTRYAETVRNNVTWLTWDGVWIGDRISWNLTNRNCYSTIANSHTLQLITARTESPQCAVSSPRCWVTSSNSER
jgi:hypothetical protein